MKCSAVIVDSRRVAFIKKHIFHASIENTLKLDKNSQKTELRMG